MRSSSLTDILLPPTEEELIIRRLASENNLLIATFSSRSDRPNEVIVEINSQSKYGLNRVKQITCDWSEHENQVLEFLLNKY